MQNNNNGNIVQNLAYYQNFVDQIEKNNK